MKIKTQPSEIWQEYQAGQGYKESLELYDTVQQCEDFFVGEQWKGCEAPDLDKPVFNILKRVVTFFVSSLVSDDIGINVEDFGEDPDLKPVLEMLDGQFDQILEMAGIRQKLRVLLRNAAVDGDGCLHYYFDPDADPLTGAGEVEPTPGAIQAEILENYNVFFGNPQSAAVQGQPYILVRYRKLLDEARQSAKENGAAEWQGIQPDEPQRGVNSDQEQGKVTVLRKYWRQRGTVWFTEVCRGCVIRPPTDTKYRHYPLVWMPWEQVKNSCHGMSAIKPLIPNQIFVNKLYAMAMRHVQMQAFPKIAYDQSKLPGGWSNRVGEAIPVYGDPGQAIGQAIGGGDMSAQVLQMIGQSISDTRDTMGASDASLGNIKPDNTSAIIATQKATAQPLELQKMAFYDLVEDSVRIWLDMMEHNYGLRYVRMAQTPGPEEEQERQTVLFDFNRLNSMDLKLNVEIGASTYWSELMQVQTLDALFANGILSDPEIYVECVPKGYIKDKGRILKSVKQAKEKQELMAQMQMMAAVPGGGG